MPKVKLDVGATVNFLSQDELEESLDKDRKRAAEKERQHLSGMKYMRPPRIQGTVYNGTIGGYSGAPAGTNSALGGPPWGPQSGYAWSVRRICVGGLANVGTGTAADVVGIYRNNINSPPIAVLTANAPTVNFNTMGCVLLGGDSLLLGHIPNQTGGNTSGTLVGTFLAADFDAIQTPTEYLGKLA